MRNFYVTFQADDKLQPMVAEISRTKNLVIMEKCKEDLKREFYIRMTKRYGWTKDVRFKDEFEEFSEKTVDSIIVGKYIADLLEMMYKYDNSVYNIDGIDYYLTLMEIIQRRNLHIHKKGIVDEKYFTKGNGSELGISVGDYAVIDNEYMHKASELLEKFVANFPD